MEEIISLRVNKELKEKMRAHDEINWSSVLRRAIVENLENRQNVDLEKRRKASEDMDRLRKQRAFDGERDSTSIIREWRNKRR